MTDARIVLTTVGTPEDAEKLSQELVERRLAACVNIVGPIRSVYRWCSEVHSDPEFLLVIKTTAEGGSATLSIEIAASVRAAGVRGTRDRSRQRRLSGVDRGRGE